VRHIFETQKVPVMRAICQPLNFALQAAVLIRESRHSRALPRRGFPATRFHRSGCRGRCAFVLRSGSPATSLPSRGSLPALRRFFAMAALSASSQPAPGRRNCEIAGSCLRNQCVAILSCNCVTLPAWTAVILRKHHLTAAGLAGARFLRFVSPMSQSRNARIFFDASRFFGHTR
jgi:hypothetical protein